MFSYKIVDSDRGPLVQIFSNATMFDECGPWESHASASEWAQSYVSFKENGGSEPVLAYEDQSTIEDESFDQSEGGN